MKCMLEWQYEMVFCLKNQHQGLPEIKVMNRMVWRYSQQIFCNQSNFVIIWNQFLFPTVFFHIMIRFNFWGYKYRSYMNIISDKIIGEFVYILYFDFLFLYSLSLLCINFTCLLEMFISTSLIKSNIILIG